MSKYKFCQVTNHAVFVLQVYLLVTKKVNAVIVW